MCALAARHDALAQNPVRALGPVNGRPEAAAERGVPMDGHPCRCGNRGYWEQYASERAPVSEAAASRGPPQLWPNRG